MSSRNRFQGWIASLSTGETVHESPPQPGELSSWQQLLQRCRADNIRITQMRLQRGGTTVAGIPNAAGYFQGYETRISNLTRKSSTMQGIGSIVDGVIYITWVNQQGDVWHDVRSLGQDWVHTNLRDFRDLI